MRSLRKILHFLFRDALGRDIATVASGNAVVQVLHLIAIPLLMLLYEPADFGIYAVYLAVVAVLAVVSALRYDFAILLATSERTIFSLLTLCTAMVGGWCAVLALLSTGAALVHNSDPWTDSPLRFATFLPLGVGLSALYTVSLQYATRKQEYGALRIARIVYGFVTLLAQGALFFVYRSPVGLILGEALGRAICVLVLMRLVFVDWRSSRTRVTKLSVAVAARRYSRFPRYLVVIDFLSTIARNAPVTLFAISFGTSVAGVYGQAQRLCGAPLTLLAQAVGRVFVGRLSSSLREKGEDIRQTFHDVSKRLIIMALVSLAGVVAAAVLLPLMLGDEWQGIGPVLILLLPSFFALFVASPVAPALSVLNRQRLHLRWEVVRLAATAGSILVAVRLGLAFEVVLFSYSVVLAGCLSLLYVLCRRTIHTNAVLR